MSNKISIEEFQRELGNLEPGEGLSMTGVLSLPESVGKLIKWLIRVRTARLEEIAAYIGEHEAAVRPMLTALVEKGLLEESSDKGEKHYRPHIVSQQKSAVPRNLWKLLE